MEGKSKEGMKEGRRGEEEKRKKIEQKKEERSGER